MKAKVLAIVAMFLICAMAGSAMAQQADQGGRGGRPGRGGTGGGNWDPSQWRQQALDRLKTELGAKDDEWQVLSPKVEKVMTLSFQSRFGRMRNRGGSSDRGGNNTPPGGDTAVSKAQTDLQSALDDKSISADEIAKRLTALRQAKDGAKQELAKAQAELKELLNQRQEAVLVLNGMLD
jgi:hypothetical protein